MGNKRKIKYSIEFLEDLNNILSYIRYQLKNNMAANKLVNKVERKIQERSQDFSEYKKYKTKMGNTYYKIYVNNYIIFYTIKDNIMIVRRICYSRSNLKNII